MARPLSIIPPSTNMQPHVGDNYMTNKRRDRPGRFIPAEYEATYAHTNAKEGINKGDKEQREGQWDTRMHPKVLAAQKGEAVVESRRVNRKHH